MNDEQKELFLAEKLKEFTDKLSEAAKDVISDVYCEYLPHVLSDTECNVSFQAQEAVERILKGQFKQDGDYLVIGELRIWLGNEFGYTGIANIIYNSAKDKIENQTIKELERKVKNLEQELEYAKRNRY